MHSSKPVGAACRGIAVALALAASGVGPAHSGPGSDAASGTVVAQLRADQLRPEIRSYDSGSGLRFEGDIPGVGTSRETGPVTRPRVVQPSRRRATIANPAAPRAYSSQWYRYCAERYRSFEPGTGLYTTRSGARRTCR